MRRLRGDYDTDEERGRPNHGLLVTDSTGAPRQLLMISRNAPPGGLLNGGRVAMSSGLFGSSGRRHIGGLLGAGPGMDSENDPWATFWASMLASIIVSTDEELANSLITMFGSDGPPEPPPPETLTAEQFDSLEKVEFAARTDAILATPLGTDGRVRVTDPDSCPICMCDYEDGMCLTRLPCSGNHVFHDDCLRTWLLGKSTNCPMCRCDCRPKSTPDPERVEDADMTADIDTAFNSIVDRVRGPPAETVPIRANHNPHGRGLLRSPESESASESRPGSVSRLRRQVTVGRYAEHFLGDIEETEADETRNRQTTPSIPAATGPASPASAALSSPISAPTSPAQATGALELPTDIVAMEDRMAAARSRRAQGAARDAAARRAESTMSAAQEARRARREAAAAAAGGTAERERGMSDWYRNHRESSLRRATEFAGLIDAEAPAAARWTATSTPTPAVVHAESQTSTLPTLSGPGISADQQPSLSIPLRQLDSLRESRHPVADEPADLSGAASAMVSTTTATRSSPSLTQRWLARGRTIGGRSETATVQIENAVSQLASARTQAAAARHSSAASSRRSAAALNENMRAAAAAEIPSRRSGSTSRLGGPRGAGRMRRLMREARDLENGGR